MWILSDYIATVSGPWKLYTNKLLNYFVWLNLLSFIKSFLKTQGLIRVE